MSTDVLSDTRSFPQPGESRDPGIAQDLGPRGRWWKRGLFALAIIAVVATAAAFISGATTRRESGPKLTHTITRDDLLVTVTEQGTLESFNNTEIKCKVRGSSTVLWVIEAGTEVEPDDVVVRLDPSTIEDNINQQKIAYQRALATHTQSETDVAVAKIAVTEYLEGTFRSQMQTLKKDLAIAESNLRTSENMLEHSQRMFNRGYVSRLDVEGHEFTVTQAQLELELIQTEIDVLDRFTRAKELETLQSTLKAAEAKLASDKAELDLEKARLDREEQQLENCVIRAESRGMVIHPSAAAWKDQPDIEEGAIVRQDQVLLMIPDLTKMQVKVGIHESKVDRIKPGMSAQVTLSETATNGEVSSVASVTRPAGWWTGNVVKYDTIIQLDTHEGLKPGMSAEVKVVLARHENVLTVPVAAVLEDQQGFSCWVKTADGFQQRALQLGDTNDQFIVVEAGLKEGDEVVLNPLAFIKEAQSAALRPLDKTQARQRGSKQAAAEATPAEVNGREPGAETKRPAKATVKLTTADKHGDGAPTSDK